MPDQKISADALITTPLSTDYVPIVSGGDNKRVAIANLVANSNPASLTISGLTSGRVTYAGTSGLLSDDSGFTYNSGTHALTATTFIGALTGNAATASAVAVGGITGLGTGVGAALALNVGSAGAPVVNGGALGSPSSVGTLPAHTLGGTVSGGGQQLNNIIIGASTPLAGFHTTLSATGTFTGVDAVFTPANTTGNGVAINNSVLTTGNTVSITASGTAAASNTKTGLNVATSGANATSAQTTYGAQIANTSTGTTSVNTALYLTTSGGATNKTLIVDGPSSSYSTVFTQGGTDVGGFYTPDGFVGFNGRGVKLFAGTSASPGNLTQWISASTGFLTNSSGAFGFYSAASISGTQDTTISRNAAGVVQFGTTAANASGSWTATNGTLSGTLNGLTITNNGTNTLSITAGKTFTTLKTISLTAADDTGVYTLPTGTKTLLATDGAGTSLTGIPYTLTGTANQITLSAGTGNITFSLPQSIATTSTPQFARIGLGTASVSNYGVASTLNLAVSGTNSLQAFGVGVPGDANTEYVDIFHNGASNAFLIVNKSGSGSYRALDIRTGGTQTMLLGTDQSATFPGAIKNTGITSDATHTDATVCVDTTSKQFYSGSGALGACLGTSSLRYKEGVKEFAKGLTDILSLKPISFMYKKGYGDGGGKEQSGFAAEDYMGTSLADLVGLDVEGKANSFDMFGLIPRLVNAIKEQQLMIGLLNTRLVTAFEQLGQ